MDDNNDVHDQEDVEEALSLSEFAITTTNQTNSNGSHHDHIRSSSEPSDFFEFFNDLSSEMAHAEDIMFCGKLIPFKQHQQQQQHQQSLCYQTSTNTASRDPDKQRSFHRKRSESLSELKSSQSHSPKTGQIRNCRSLDYQTLRRTSSESSETSEISRNSSVRSIGRAENFGQKVMKPRWYVLMFGILKFPLPEMELRDIKSRQVRRTPATMFPALDGGEKIPFNRSYRKISWGLLKVLSCKANTSVAVTASLGCLPKV